MSTLIENLILKMLREDVSEVDGTTELSVTAGNTPKSESGYDVKLLGTKSYGKGKLRTQNAQKIAKQQGAVSAFVITFVKPWKTAPVNDNFILDDIKTICTMVPDLGSGNKAKYNDGKHTFIIIPVKSTNRKKVFHVWIYDTSVYENAIEEIQNKLQNNTPVTGTLSSRVKPVTKLSQIPIVSKTSFENWVNVFKDTASKTNTNISTLSFPDLSNVTDIEIKISSTPAGSPPWEVTKDLGNGQKIITINAPKIIPAKKLPSGQDDPNNPELVERDKSPINGFYGDILWTSTETPAGEIIDTYLPYDGTLIFKDEDSNENVKLTGKFKDGYPIIASSITYVGVQKPTEIKSFDGQITKENVVTIGKGSRATSDSFAKLKVFLKEGTATFNNNREYTGTWFTDDSSLSMQKQSLKFKTGYITTIDGNSLGKYVNGVYSKTAQNDSDTKTNSVAVESVTYPYEWQTTDGIITINTEAEYVYFLNDTSWYEYPKSKFETDIKTVDNDLKFKKILQNDRINQLNIKHGKTAKTEEPKPEPTPKPEPKPKKKKKTFTITATTVNLYSWSSNQFESFIPNVPKDRLEPKYTVTAVKTGKIKGKGDSQYTMYSIGSVTGGSGTKTAYISSSNIKIKEE